MGVDVTLAGVISVLSLGVAVSSLWLARRRDQTSEARQFEQRIRVLEDRMLQLDHYATLRLELPGHVTDLEYQVTALQASVKRLETRARGGT